MIKPYKLDLTGQNSTFKLSILYWNKGECDNAWSYDECKAQGGRPGPDAQAGGDAAGDDSADVDFEEVK